MFDSCIIFKLLLNDFKSRIAAEIWLCLCCQTRIKRNKRAVIFRNGFVSVSCILEAELGSAIS
jgi:hypothetical protein